MLRTYNRATIQFVTPVLAINFLTSANTLEKLG
jgi:hypothetical protein